jgi:nucleotide-binding universal stress UspA family protein
MKTIVAPTDFSADSLNAVYYAADIAQALKTKLSIIYVYKIPVTLEEISVQQYDPQEIFSDAEDKMEELKKRIDARTNTRVTIITELMEGSVSENIETYCNSVNTYAVVMGSEPESGFDRMLFGERTISAMKKLDWPLIIVPPAVQFNGIRKIGFACDFEDPGNTIPVKEIKNLVEAFHAELHVVFVSRVSARLFDAYTKEQSGWMKEMFAGLNPKYDFIKAEQIDEKIINYAENNKIDLLIVIPKTHSFLHKIFKHSHAKRIVLHAHTPIMTIHE